ncbi:MAG: cell division protein FtsZ [Leptothrix sp. (in: b-proteobacteria)]
MSTLQLGLAVVGGLVLAGVVAHGAWQTRRAGGARGARDGRDGLEGTRDAPPPDTVLQPREPSFGHTEPAFDDAADAARGAAGLVSRTLAPGALGAIDAVDTVPGELLPLPLALRRSGYTLRIDALIDGIANLALDGPVSGETVLSHLPPSRRAGGKPVVIEGREIDSGDWEAPAANRWYSELQAGVQLANRLGPINEIEFSEFVQKIQAFADALGAAPDFPDMLDVVARGRELDAFAGDHDAQLAMRLQARVAPWPIAKVAAHASRHGFVPGLTPGRLVLPAQDDGAPPMLVLQFDAQAALADDPQRAQVTELTLMFDVPATPAAEDPFNAWCAAGQALSIALDAQVEDDQGRPLAPEAFPQIGEDLAALYAALAERDLAAGSLPARRLFS